MRTICVLPTHFLQNTKGELMKTAIITVASNMSDKTYERICKGFAEKLGEISFEKVTDDKIIGGFIAEIDGKIFDMSIASQIAKMQKQISN